MGGGAAHQQIGRLPYRCVSVPPGKSSRTGIEQAQPRSAAKVAQAPVPQARVRPAPRSQTRIADGRGRRRAATLTLIRSGNSGSCLDHRAKPRRGRSLGFIDEKDHMRIADIDRRRLVERLPAHRQRSVSIASRAGLRASRSGATHVNGGTIAGRPASSVPARVSIISRGRRGRATHRVRCRRPRPRRRRCSRCASSRRWCCRRTIRINWSQPMPVRRSASARGRGPDRARRGRLRARRSRRNRCRARASCGSEAP